MELDGVVTIKSVVSDVMFKYGIKQEDYVFLLSTVIDAYRKLNLSVLRQQLYHDDYVNDINIIEFPNDLIMFESIGRIDAGEYKSTTLTDNASPTGTLNGRESLDTGESVANNADPITSFCLTGLFLTTPSLLLSLNIKWITITGELSFMVMPLG